LERAELVDNRVVEAIENNEMMELSTGLFTDHDNTPGVWNNEKYLAVARNYRPDHLALLPDKLGACSIEDGAGFLRVNEAKTEITFNCDSLESDIYKYILDNQIEPYQNWWAYATKKWVENQMSFDDMRYLIWLWLEENRTENTYIEEVYTDFFIFVEDEKFYKQNYSVNDGALTAIGAAVSVEKKIDWVTAEGASIINIDSKEITMDKKELVDNLISNTNTSWKEDHRKTLMSMDDDILTNMLPVVNEDDEKETEKDPATEGTEEIAQVTENKKVLTADEYIAQAPAEIQEVLINSKNVYDAEKNSVIASITANENNQFSAEQLADKSLDELRQIAALAKSAVPAMSANNRFNFAGQAPVANNTTPVKEEPMALPVVNFDDRK